MSERLWSPELLPCWHPSQSNSMRGADAPKKPASAVGKGGVWHLPLDTGRPATAPSAPARARPGKTRSHSAQIGESPRNGRGHRASTRPVFLELGTKIDELVALTASIEPAVGQASRSAPVSRVSSPPPERPGGRGGAATTIAAERSFWPSPTPAGSMSVPASASGTASMTGIRAAAAPWSAYQKLRRVASHRIPVGVPGSSQQRTPASRQQLSLSAPF